MLVNDWLAGGCGQGRITPLLPPTLKPLPPGQEGAGTGRCLTLDEPLDLHNELLPRIKAFLGLPHGTLPCRDQMEASNVCTWHLGHRHVVVLTY